MNMAVDLEGEGHQPDTVQILEDDRAPKTVVGRLREFYRVRAYPVPDVWASQSAIFSVLHAPGRATNTQSDGGLSSLIERKDGPLAQWNRCQEVGAALRAMPTEYRVLIDATYDVPALERPRTVRTASDKCHISTTTYSKRMTAALCWLQGRLCMNLQI
jgi:hypothetical protein